MLLINKDVSKVKEIVQKQASYLNSSDSGNFFKKNHYSFFMNDEYLSVSFLLEEQSSGSCWDEEVSEPDYYFEKPSLVKKALRVLLSAILPRENDKRMSDLVDLVFNQMDIHTKRYSGYYGNYEVFKRYTINISDVYVAVDNNTV